MQLKLLLMATPLLAGIPSVAHASPCKSEWVKLGQSFKKFGPIVAKAICQYTNNDNAAAANKCVQDYENAVQQVEAAVRTYNTNATGGKIGPRHMGPDRWYNGRLIAERTMVMPNALSDTYTLEFTGTGGKGKKPFTVTVCFVDAKGKEVIPSVSKTFTNNNGHWVRSFSGVAGAQGMVYLKNKTFFTTNAHRWKLRMSSGSEPPGVRRARSTLRSAPGRSGSKTATSRPSTGRPGARPVPTKKPTARPVAPVRKGKPVAPAKKPTAPSRKGKYKPASKTKRRPGAKTRGKR